MGTFSPAILGDDVALDVRDIYLNELREGKSGSAAGRAVLQHMKEDFSDEDDGPVAWLALAATQWLVGRLEDQVKRKALKIIEQGNWKERWAPLPKLLRKREIVVSRLKKQLQSKQPNAKKFAVRKEKSSPFADWKPGEFAAFKLNGGSWSILWFQKNSDGKYPAFKIANWEGKSLPDKTAIARLRMVDGGSFIAVFRRES